MNETHVKVSYFNFGDVPDSQKLAFMGKNGNGVIAYRKHRQSTKLKIIFDLITPR
jgi:hypothetical protein